MKINPLDDKLVVEPITETTTPGGILLPDSAKTKTGRGKVLAIGPGARARDFTVANPIRIPLSVKAGDVVLFGSYAGHEEEINGTKLRILSEHDVLGTLED